MPVDVIFQVLIGGILLGGLYALVAFGLSLIYGIVRVLNFAHGTLLAVSGVIASLVFTSWHWHPVFIGLLLAPAVFVFGYVFYMVLLHPLEHRSEFESVVGGVLITVGAMLILSDATTMMAGATQRTIQVPFESIDIGQIVVSTTQLYILVGIAALTLGVHVFLKKTWFGRAIRAVTQDSTGAQICGVDGTRLKSLTFAFGSATVAVAAILYAMSFPVSPYMGFPLTVKAFTIIVLGGIGNLRGALLAGIFLGVAESMTGLFWKAEWAPALSVVLMLVILVAFPRVAGRTVS
ncbi:MAG: branched-chain amino acid ABC transporter permease [Burkholderiaceae bacterium]|nr:MAG: branched-chain amino acid ABC transporter permease [Burkholderiaceae bacterium]TAM10265.1 MAG: branched-chain amino acid ABC transporter permease [Pusillimonas sp.]